MTGPNSPFSCRWGRLAQRPVDREVESWHDREKPDHIVQAETLHHMTRGGGPPKRVRLARRMAVNINWQPTTSV